MSLVAENAGADYLIRRPRLTDAAAIHGLIERCPPLDTNSLYCNLLQCAHHAETCALAEGEDGRAAGFVSSYRLPEHPDNLFVWQVAIDERDRGKGLAKRLIYDVLARPASRDVRYLRLTITPENGPSWVMFRSLAEDLQADAEQHMLFDSKEHLDSRHSSEHELVIGPLDLSSFTNKGS